MAIVIVTYRRRFSFQLCHFCFGQRYIYFVGNPSSTLYALLLLALALAAASACQICPVGNVAKI